MIFLSSFVMITQNRQGHAAEIRSELDYRTNVMAEREIDLVMRALDRMARQQGVGVDDLMVDLQDLRASYGNPIDKDRAPQDVQALAPGSADPKYQRCARRGTQPPAGTRLVPG